MEGEKQDINNKHPGMEGIISQPILNVMDLFEKNQIQFNYTINDIQEGVEELPDLLKVKIFKVPKRDKFFMVVIPNNYEIKQYMLEVLTGYKNLKQLDEKRVRELTKCEKEHIHPFGNMWNWNVYMDQSIRTKKIIQFRLGQNNHDLTMRYEDYVKIQKHFLIDIAEPNPDMFQKESILSNKLPKHFN